MFNFQKSDQPSRSSFLLNSGIVRVKSLNGYFFQHWCDQYCCGFHAHNVISLVDIASEFFSVQFFSEMLSVTNDFRLTNFPFFRRNVALSNLAENLGCVFCFCAPVKVRDFRILGKLIFIWNQSVNNLGTKHEDLKQK